MKKVLKSVLTLALVMALVAAPAVDVDYSDSVSTCELLPGLTETH